MEFNRIVLIIILCGMFGTASALSDSGGANWEYSKEINIQENSGKMLADYQVLIKLDSSNFDFDQAKSDGSDIRFTLGGVELPYWIEKWDRGVQMKKQKFRLNCRLFLQIVQQKSKFTTGIRAQFSRAMENPLLSSLMIRPSSRFLKHLP